MPKISKADLLYKDYSWTAVPGDDPSKTRADGDRFSRKEGYEVINLLNALTGSGGSDLTVKTRQICEWMIHEKMPGGIQGRSKVISWIAESFPALKGKFPF